MTVMAVSMCSVTSQREPSPVTSGSDYLKRPRSSDAETEFEPSVKLKCPVSGTGGGGGGRRKQSKPIRVRADMEPSPVEDLVVDVKLPATQSSPVTGDPPPAVTDSCQEGPAAETFDVDYRKPEPSAMFPTKYHQLGSELKQEVGLGPYVSDSGEESGKTAFQKSEIVEDPRSDLEIMKRSPRHEAGSLWNHAVPLQDQSFMSKLDCLPTNLSMRSFKMESPGNCDAYSAQSVGRDMDLLSRGTELQDAERFWEGSDVGNSSSEKSRIFHPDAFCDICEREFCNKYFLKTHRANKHGLYDGPGSDAGAGCSSSAVPPAMSALVFSQATTLAGVDTPSASVTDRERATSSSVSCSSTSSLSGVLPIPQLPSNLALLPYDDVPARSADMDDYCNICQKHFCNKYYLRKHRQDVHGLSPVDAAARRLQSDFTRASSDVADGSTTPHFPLRISSSGSSSTLPPTPSALSSFPMFLPPPPFGAPLPVVPPLLPSAAAGLGFSSLPFGDASSSKLPSSSSTSQSPSQQVSGGGGTSSLLPGMMGSDAYMDLFRKELLGGYLINNGDRGVTAAIMAVAAAAASASGGDPGPPPPRLPPMPTSSEPSAPVASDTPANPTPDTFAEMLQRIGARIGKKSDGLGSLHQDLFRMNGLGPGGPGRMSGSLSSNPVSASTSSSRLVDRVVCDICNKEVCNKYFLKTHKMKVHGWDPNTSTVPPPAVSTTSAITAEPALVKSEPPLLSSSQPPMMYFPPLPGSHVDKPLAFPPPPASVGPTPKDLELQKMGIDPEAYCEICRKEFCSKYFLRTHRQNIHGIQDASTSSPPGSYQAPPLHSATSQPFSSVVLPPPAPPSLSLPSSLSTSCSTSSSSSSSVFLFGAGGLSNSDPASSADGHVLEQRSWKWKEPVNATRVSCTLCNKVLCNKYFLRTHMAKRHGVTVDTRLQPPITLVQSASSHPSTNGLHQFGASSTLQDSDMVDQKEADTDGVTVKTGGAVNLALSGRSSADVQTVTARTWQVPADDMPSQGSENSDPGGVPAPTDDSVKCPLCAAAVSDCESLLRHFGSVHHVDEQTSLSLVTAVGQNSGLDSTSVDGFEVSRPPTMVGGGAVMRRRRQFRCAFCRERFRTRVHCELHARAAHPRASGSCVEVTPVVDRSSLTPPVPSTSSALPPPVYATPLDASDAARSQMLPYVLRESPASGEDSDLHFSTALVYLPTLRRLTSPTTVTFSVTPVVQP